MSELFDLKFLFPLWLLLLPFCWWLIWYFIHHSQNLSMWNVVCDSRFLPLLTTEPPKQKNKQWLAILLAVISSTGIVALAGPSWEKMNSQPLDSIAARVFILDLSSSMLVEDVKPNRITKTLDTMRLMLESEFAGETGLIVFSGAAFVVSPLTRDSETLLEFSKSLHPETMPVDGERLDLAINQASTLLSSSITGSGQLIIFTDSSDNSDKVISSVKDASSQGHLTSIIAIGSLQGAPLKNVNGSLKRDELGEFILVKTNFTKLESIAQVAQSELIKLIDYNANIESLIVEMNALSTRAAQPDASDSDKNIDSDEWDNAGIWLVWAMLPMTLLLFRKNAFWILLIVFSSPMIASLNNDFYAADYKEDSFRDYNSIWLNSEQRAFRAYQDGNFEKAIELTNNAALAGAALYESERYSAAFDTFSKQADSAVSFYHRANALVFQQKFDKALAAYNRCLTLDPYFEDALINKQLVETYLASNAENVDGSQVVAEQDDELANIDSDVQPIIGESDPLDDSRTETDMTGVGAGPQFLMDGVLAEEQFSGDEIKLEQLEARLEKEGLTINPDQLKQWTESLTNNPTELFQRKFLRDYKRSQIKEGVE